MHLAVLIDGDTVAYRESFVGELESELVRHVGADVVVKRPSAGGKVNEMTEAVLAVRMKSCNSARPAVLSPKFRIDPAVGIER